MQNKRKDIYKEKYNSAEKDKDEKRGEESKKAWADAKTISLLWRNKNSCTDP